MGKPIKQAKTYTPAQLLCQAIEEKLSPFCGNRPNAFILAPQGILQRDITRCHRLYLSGRKIYIELVTGCSGPTFNKIYHRALFFIDVTAVTDHTNIMRETFFRDRFHWSNEYHVFTNLSVSYSQAGAFIKEFMTYLHFGDISLRTTGDADSITTESMLNPPPRSLFWRWVAFDKM